MENELVSQITSRTGLSEDQARQVVQVIADYLKQKLPPPLASQVDTLLTNPQSANMTQEAGNIIGGLFNKQQQQNQ